MCIRDRQIIGQRHKDLKNGLTSPPKPTLPNLLNIATKPRWALGMAKTPRRQFRNIVGHVKGVADLADLTAWTNEQFDPRLDWKKVARIRDQWGGKLVLKGVLDAEDAQMAVDLGADAVIVSNHGGRQLDGALSSIRTLPSVVRAVGDQTEVWLDSGIRSGQDVLKALAMGAKGTMIGRAYVHGLGAMGYGINLEVFRHGILSTVIGPAEVATPILDKRPVPVTPEERARLLQPEDLAASIMHVVLAPRHVCILSLIHI